MNNLIRIGVIITTLALIVMITVATSNKNQVPARVQFRSNASIDADDSNPQRPQSTVVFSKPTPSPVFPTVGNIRVRDVRISYNILTVGVGPYAPQNWCALQLASGIHIKAEVDLEAVLGTRPTYYGSLAFVQNVNFHRRRAPPQWECADSHLTPLSPSWELDGGYPYSQRVSCGRGSNAIELDDAPRVFLEIDVPPPVPFERVFVDDKFRSYLIWEATDNSKTPTATNPAKRHVLARVDWIWKGSATNIGSSQAQCPSQLLPPNGWNLDSGWEARVGGVMKGKDAIAAPPPAKVATPCFPHGRCATATPDNWVRCP